MAKFAEISGGKVVSIHLDNAAGRVEVPADVYAGFLDNGDGTFSAPLAPAVVAEQVKSAASRIILELLPDWQQRNFIARGAELIRKVQLGGALTQDELDEETAMQALWAKVKAIRAKSDELEALSPIPADYADQLAAIAST